MTANDEIGSAILSPIVILRVADDEIDWLWVYPGAEVAEATVPVGIVGQEGIELYDAKARSLSAEIVGKAEWKLVLPEEGEEKSAVLEGRLRQWCAEEEVRADVSAMDLGRLLEDASVRFRYDAEVEPWWKAVLNAVKRWTLSCSKAAGPLSARSSEP